MDGIPVPFLVLAAVVASFVGGVAGFALGVVGQAMLLPFVAPTIVAPFLLVGSVVTQSMAIARLRGAVHLRRLAPFVVGGLIGVPLGHALLRMASTDDFRRSIGALLLVYSAYALLRPSIQTVPSHPALDALVGAIGGVMGGFAALSGLVPTIWCAARGWNRDEQRAVYQPFILITQFAALAYGGSTGSFTWPAIMASLFAVPGFVLGSWLGLRLYARLDERRFRQIVDLLLAASGVSLLF
jgi:uncharacterized membrane protein YfcA